MRLDPALWYSLSPLSRELFRPTDWRVAEAQAALGTALAQVNARR
jgi:hypothetical protein